MLQSMTAYASRTGAGAGLSWTWELRGVNARGLDLRLRLPDSVPGLEPAARAAVQGAVTRGAVTLGLRLTREAGEGTLALDAGALDRVLAALEAVQARACDLGVTLAQPTAADVLAMRGVIQQTGDETADCAAVLALLTDDLAPLVTDFTAMRRHEGAALAQVIGAQLDQIAALVAEAADAAAARVPKQAQGLAAALERLRVETPEIAPARLAQELALIAVRQDITEEIDRLGGHVAAARAMLAEGGPVGRKLDFLAQEFNREANTLCSKAQDPALTAVGLALKTVIDQMREQVQNLE